MEITGDFVQCHTDTNPSSEVGTEMAGSVDVNVSKISEEQNLPSNNFDFTKESEKFQPTGLPLGCQPTYSKLEEGINEVVQLFDLLETLAMNLQCAASEISVRCSTIFEPRLIREALSFSEDAEKDETAPQQPDC